ncbi:MAG: phosphatidylglycerol lysyltransferase domain-containing protein [Oscillospiraceae bacterium]|nr:phosphatidylglycerol lysyltransferase domain-containing protein [Oscillospiraceae bacterium]
MFEFREIELSDKPWADEHLKFSGNMSCEYSFGNNFIWKGIYDLKVCDTKKFYLIQNIYGFLFPAGDFDIKTLVDELKKYTATMNKPLCFSSMSKENSEKLSEIYGGAITVTSNRDFFDYVYTHESLSTLKGKKLHSKRNHINRFKDNDWSYETITKENIEECFQLSRKWCKINECGKNSEMEAEICAVNLGLKNYFDLDFKGGLLRADGEIQAFTFGEHLTTDTFVVHAEKAFTDFQGAYPTINHEFVKSECNGYKFINREEDNGEPNLRKAKLSYKPEFMVEKFKVIFNS